MEKTPFIGQLDRKIQIVELVKTQNTTGEMEVAQLVLSEPYAQMNDVSGNEDVEGKIRHIINRFYIIRYSETIRMHASELILIDNGQQFSIYHAVELGRKKYLKLLVRDYE
jgi:head-tail adaptor